MTLTRPAGLTLWLALATAPAFGQGALDVEERYARAVDLMGAGEYERAIGALQNIIAEHPDFSRAYRSLERAYVILDDMPAARNYLAERLDETPDNAYVHHALGRVIPSSSLPEGLRGDDDDAIALMERAITLDPMLPEAYRDLAYFYSKKGEPELAEAYLRARLSDTPRGARAYYGLGCLYVNEHDSEKALSALGRAIELDDDLTLAHSERIAVFGQSGSYAEVITAATRLLEAAAGQDEFQNVSYAHRALGMSYSYLGDYWRALHHLAESLKLAEQSGEKSQVAAALIAIGNIYVTLGAPERALESHRASLELARVSKDDQAEGIALNNIGHDLAEAGRAEESFPYYEEALQIARKGRFRHDESVVQLNLASARNDVGDRERAVAEYLEALALARELDNMSSEGAILKDLGNIEIRRGRFSEAARYFEEAAAAADRTGDVEFRWTAMGGLGRVYEHRGDTERAIAHYAEAVALYDEARSFDLESMGSGFLDHNPNVYPPLIRLLAEEGRVEEAFEHAQKYKATSLLQIVSQGRRLLGDLLPEAYRTRLAELGHRLDAAHAAMSAARARTGVEPNDEEVRKLERELSSLAIEKTALMDELRRQEGSYYQLASPEPATLEEIRTCLSPGQALIDYVVGAESISTFVVTATKLTYHALPIGTERLQQMLTALSPVFEKDKSMDEETRASVFSAAVADFSIPPAEALYQVLFEPLESDLEELPELVIVPDGLLHYLPFEALVADAEGAEHPYDFRRARFLLESHGVSYAASASLLLPGPQKPRHAEGGLLAFGNPDFNRPKVDRLPAEYYESALTFSGGVVRGDQLLPLPGATAEVEAITKTLNLPESHLFVGSEATEAAFKREAGRHRILHLATHFLSDDRQPLYSKIVLARGDDAEEDGYLQTYEIFNTRLNADLVVLSACSTGLGKLSKGEGLAGVSRAFLYAGVPSLVVSLWQVDDEATSALMQSFYRNLKTGMTKNTALRRAKLDYLRAAPDDKKDPFYWAPFILLGDSQPLDLPEAASSWRFIWATMCLVSLAALGLGLGRRRRRENGSRGGAPDIRSPLP